MAGPGCAFVNFSNFFRAFERPPAVPSRGELLWDRMLDAVIAAAAKKHRHEINDIKRRKGQG